MTRGWRVAALAVLALTGCNGILGPRRLATVETPPPGAEAPRPPAAAPAPPPPTATDEQMVRLADELASLRNALAQLIAASRRYDDQLADLQRRTGELEAQARSRPSGAPPGFAAAPLGGAQAAAPTLTTRTAEELYQDGMRRFEGREFDSAVLLFYELIVTYPDHALRESAQFLVGEIFYTQQDYRGALGEFEALVRDVPRGRKIADALVKIGMAQRELGQAEAARSTWERVLREHPTSVAARQARVLLRR